MQQDQFNTSERAVRQANCGQGIQQWMPVRSQCRGEIDVLEKHMSQTEGKKQGIGRDLGELKP